MVRLAGVVATAAAARLYEARELNKEIVKQTMRSLEACDLQTAREKYREYVGSARLDRSGSKSMSKGRQNSRATYPTPWTAPLALRQDSEYRRWTSPKSKVERSAVVTTGGRLFIIAVPTGKFVCDGNDRSMPSWRESAPVTRSRS